MIFIISTFHDISDWFEDLDNSDGFEDSDNSDGFEDSDNSLKIRQMCQLRQN